MSLQFLTFEFVKQKIIFLKIVKKIMKTEMKMKISIGFGPIVKQE